MKANGMSNNNGRRNVMKRVFSVILMAVLLSMAYGMTFAALAAEDYSVEGWYTVYSIVPKDHDYSYIYSKPSSTKGENLCRVDDGQPVYVYYKTNGLGSKSSQWAYCDYANTFGYIRFDNLVSEAYSGYTDDGHYCDTYDPYVDYVEDEGFYAEFEYIIDSFDYIGVCRIVNCDEWVSLREYADSSSTRLAKVQKGTRVDAFYFNDKWTVCRYGNEFGFIKTKYLKVQ